MPSSCEQARRCVPAPAPAPSSAPCCRHESCTGARADRAQRYPRRQVCTLCRLVHRARAAVASCDRKRALRKLVALVCSSSRLHKLLGLVPGLGWSERCVMRGGWTPEGRDQVSEATVPTTPTAASTPAATRIKFSRRMPLLASSAPGRGWALMFQAAFDVVNLQTVCLICVQGTGSLIPALSFAM